MGLGSTTKIRPRQTLGNSGSTLGDEPDHEGLGLGVSRLSWACPWTLNPPWALTGPHKNMGFKGIQKPQCLKRKGIEEKHLGLRGWLWKANIGKGPNGSFGQTKSSNWFEFGRIGSSDRFYFGRIGSSYRFKFEPDKVNWPDKVVWLDRFGFGRIGSSD